MQCFRECGLCVAFIFHTQTHYRLHSIIRIGKLSTNEGISKNHFYIALNFIYALPIWNTRCHSNFSKTRTEIHFSTNKRTMKNVRVSHNIHLTYIQIIISYANIQMQFPKNKNIESIQFNK